MAYSRPHQTALKRLPMTLSINPAATESAIGPKLSEEMNSFITSGVSITACARDSRLIPSISRILACTTQHQGALVRLFLVKSQALQLLRDIAANGEIAVVFSQPSSHKTLQVKGTQAHQTAVLDCELAAIESGCQGFADNVFLLGFDYSFSRTFQHYTPADLTAIEFTLSAVFEQSPGPDAGRAIELNR